MPGARPASSRLLGIFPDRAVAGEFAGSGRVEDGHARPFALVAKDGIGARLAIAVSAEISQHHIGVSAVQQAVVHGKKSRALCRREVVGSQPVDRRAQFFVGIVVIPWIVAFGPQRITLLRPSGRR